MKKIVIALISFLCFSSAHSQIKNFIDQPNVEVYGRYDSLVTPNEIYIKILISENDNKGKISVEEMERNMISTLQSLGINTEKDLAVSDMSNNYKSYFLKKTDVLTSKAYQLKVGDAKTLSRVFVSLESLGISNTSVDRVDHSDIEKIKNDIRSKAVNNAKEKAQALAKPLNQSIGNAIHIIELQDGYNINARPVAMMMKDARMNEKNEEPADIDFEKNKISRSVSGVFILK